MLLISPQAFAYVVPVNCASDGAHAEVYNATLNIWTCVSVTGSGGAVSITALDPFIVVSPSPITGTGTITAGNFTKAMTTSVAMLSYGGI